MEVALTFDDGPGPFTEQVLEVLQRHKVPATFFVLGRHVDASGGYEQVVKMLRAGHQVGNHSYSHSNKLNPEGLGAEFAKVDEIIRAARAEAGSRVGEAIPVRLPYGTKPNDPRLETFKGTGRVPIDWDVIPGDWRRQEDGDGERMAADMIKEIGKRGPGKWIVLLHDACAEDVRESRLQTVKAVDSLLMQTRTEWQFVTLS